MNQLSSPETEERLLAAVIHNYDEAIIRADGLHSKLFTKKLHRIIYQTLLELSNGGDKVEELALVRALQGKVDASTIVGMGQVHIPSVEFVEADTKALKDLFHLRVLKQQFHNILRNIDEGELPSVVIEKVEGLVLSLQPQGSTRVEDLKVISNNWADELTLRYDSQKPPGLYTGYPSVDKRMGGLVPGQLVIIGSRPGVGKTTLALNLASNISRRDVSVGFISLEMTASELTEKLICLEGEIDGSMLKKARIDGEVFKYALEIKTKIEGSPLYIIDWSRSDLHSLINLVKGLIYRQGIQLLFIDYLQLMEVGRKTETRNQELAKITRTLKALAVKYRIPIVLLSQLNRDPDKTKKPQRPRLAHLRDSGAIEQDANVVLLLHSTKKKGHEILEMGIAKNRSGSTGRIDFSFQKKYSRISELARHSEQEALFGMES